MTTAADILLNLTLELGSLTEQVTVSAEVSRVSTETATIQQLVDTKRIVELPLNGRDVYQLARLVPGVGQSGTNIGGGRSGSQNSGMANVRVDGSLNVDNVFQQLLPSPSPDAVQEFTIQTSVPSARYGYASGVIEISTRSGTNELHGSLYEFLRNDKLDARSFSCPRKQNASGTSTDSRRRSGLHSETLRRPETEHSGSSTWNSKKNRWGLPPRSSSRRRLSLRGDLLRLLARDPRPFDEPGIPK